MFDAPFPAGTIASEAGTLSYREERFTDLAEEGAPLFARHWLEASADLSVPLGFFWPQYEALESAGCLLTATVRRGEVLRGYAVYRLGPNPHCRQLFSAQSDLFFIDRPERGRAGKALFAFAEKILRDREVQEVLYGVRTFVKGGLRQRRNYGAFFQSLGCAPIEVTYRKRIDR